MDRTRRRMRRGRYLRDVHNFLFLVNPLTHSAYSSNLLTKFPIIRLLCTPCGSHMSLSPCDPPHKKRARAAPMRRAESCTPRRACLERLLSSLPCSYRRLSTLFSPPQHIFIYDGMLLEAFKKFQLWRRTLVCYLTLSLNVEM